MYLLHTKTALTLVTKKWVGSKLLLAWALLTLFGNAFAKDLGVIGSLYPIKENHALNGIQEKLIKMQGNGEIARLQEKLKDKALKSIERPKGANGLKVTTHPRTFEKDLSITVTTDIKGSHGEIIQKAGTRLNPLLHRISQKSLLFFDGDNEQQLQWALKQYHLKKGLVKLVLVNGPVLDLMRQHEIPFYFDQWGKLTQYFKIEQIPALVVQKGDKLMISEIKL